LLQYFEHLGAVDLDFFTPAITFPFTAEFGTTPLAFFNTHLNGSW
jgi:hypothetical protein